MGPEHENRERAGLEILLIRKILIDGDERIEASLHGLEKRAVIQVAPTHLGGVPDFES